jgi:hypothetical protein
MRFNRRAETGFMEAIISMMAVTMVLSMYLVFVAASATGTDGGTGIDIRMLDIDVRDGYSLSEDYIAEFMEVNELSGIQVHVAIPFYDDDGITFVAGIAEGLVETERAITLVDYQDGRRVLAIVEVSTWR